MVRGVALAACGVVAGVHGGQGVRSRAVTLSDAQNGRRAADSLQGRRRAWHNDRAAQRAHRAATGHDRGTGWA